MVTESNPDGPVKVVDRRWWTRTEGESAGGAAGSPRKPTFVEELERQVADKDKAIQEYAQRYRESANEFEEVRARLRRDLDKEVDRARRAVLADFLEVVDNLDRAIAAATAGQTADRALLQGVQLVRDLFLARLATYGVVPIPAEGHRFDPKVHDAIAVVPVSDPAQDEVVAAVVKAGYAIGDQVLRPAAVAVGRLAGEA